MQREKRIAEQQERYLARQAARRLRKMKSHSLPGIELCQHPGADAAAVGNIEGMKAAKAAAVYLSVDGE